LKNYKLVNFCEFDKHAIQSYCKIHGVNESLNLGDITQVNEKEIDDFNMMTWGFPCTDISLAGKQVGFIDEDGNKTRSGMYYEGIRILREKKPSISIIENVKNLTAKKFEHEFKTVLKDLDNAGYNTYWKVMNAKFCGIPQNRERVIMLSIRKDLDNGKFKFPQDVKLKVQLKDLLEDGVEEKYYVKQDIGDKLKIQLINKEISNSIRIGGRGSLDRHSWDLVAERVRINQATKQGYIECKIGGVADLSYPESKTRRGRVQESGDICPTITATQTNICKIESAYRYRRLTPLECFRIMGFKDEDFYKAKSIGIRDVQLYKQAGNSIVPDVLYYIFIELYNAMPYLFEDLRLTSFFSGIGAFERALDKFYEHITSNN
jgi:DNA (cytosine-5)-methyltransferase 1